MSEYEEQTLAQDVSLILNLLQGNPLDDKDNGLIGTVNKLDADFMKLKNFMYILLGIIVVLSFFAGIGIGEVKDIFKF